MIPPDAGVYRLLKFPARCFLIAFTQLTVTHIAYVPILSHHFRPVIQFLQHCQLHALYSIRKNRALNPALISDCLIFFQISVFPLSPLVRNNQPLRILLPGKLYIGILLNKCSCNICLVPIHFYNRISRILRRPGQCVAAPACRNIDNIRRRSIDHQICTGIPVESVIQIFLNCLIIQVGRSIIQNPLIVNQLILNDQSQTTPLLHAKIFC